MVSFHSYVSLPEGTPKTVVFNTQKVQMVSKWCPNGVQMVSKWSDLDDLGCQFEETRWVSESGFCLLIQLPFEEGQFKGIYIISEIEHDDFSMHIVDY